MMEQTNPASGGCALARESLWVSQGRCRKVRYSYEQNVTILQLERVQMFNDP